MVENLIRSDGAVLARMAPGFTTVRELEENHFSTYLILTKDEHGDLSEEFDVDARSESLALELVNKAIREDYQPGLKIHTIEKVF